MRDLRVCEITGGWSGAAAASGQVRRAQMPEPLPPAGPPLVPPDPDLPVPVEEPPDGVPIPGDLPPPPMQSL